MIKGVLFRYGATKLINWQWGVNIRTTTLEYNMVLPCKVEDNPCHPVFFPPRYLSQRISSTNEHRNWIAIL